ncbi:hypothetical protein [Brevibacterium moorei]|uniref:hypothetical protein n=1 Tax=Brevibacterium moorei TaxID=2968457 RepID=UPI00211BE9EB|nr:hypothetical protein [Brevibacterium sp. 68QC2CO]MCQ9384402.1 hypothetical protein [Brevibacterium sp. 68QC2CO]
MSWYHGGIPGLKPGDLIEPGHERKQHDGCPWCEARAQGEAFNGMDGPSLHPDRVYASCSRLYARFHASLYGHGDLYRVEPIGVWRASQEDSMPSITAPAFQVAAVLDRAVELTMTERRRLTREWREADRAAGLTEPPFAYLEEYKTLGLRPS